MQQSLSESVTVLPVVCTIASHPYLDFVATEERAGLQHPTRSPPHAYGETYSTDDQSQEATPRIESYCSLQRMLRYW